MCSLGLMWALGIQTYLLILAQQAVHTPNYLSSPFNYLYAHTYYTDREARLRKIEGFSFQGRPCKGVAGQSDPRRCTMVHPLGAGYEWECGGQLPISVTRSLRESSVMEGSFTWIHGLEFLTPGCLLRLFLVLN